MVQLVAYRKNNTENSGAWRSGTQSVDALMGVDTKDTSFLFSYSYSPGSIDCQGGSLQSVGQV